jgi:hypothetical protein
MYMNKNAIATAGKTKPTRGTKIEGRKDAAIMKIPLCVYESHHRSYLNLFGKNLTKF